jgi:hypothetical protein
MITGLGTVLDRLQTAFGNPFLLAGYLPVLVFAVASLAAADWVFPSTQPWLKAFADAGVAEQAPRLLLFLFATAVTGFLFWCLNPWFRECLEGAHLLPAVLRRWLEVYQQEQRDRLEERWSGLRDELFEFRRAGKQWPDYLLVARRAGIASAANVPVPRGLTDQYRALRRLRRWRLPIAFRQVLSFGADVATQLCTTSANAVPELDALHGGILELLAYGSGIAEREAGRLHAKRTFLYPQGAGVLGPTLMANLSAVHRDYAWRQYRIDIDVFWARLQKIAQADAAFYQTFEQAKTQLDFAVAMTAASALFTLVWAPIVFSVGGTIWQFGAVFLGGLMAAHGFYWLAVRNYRAFGEMLRSVLDLYRFDLLKALHIDLPANGAAERVLWEQLSEHASLRSGLAIPYRHA